MDSILEVINVTEPVANQTGNGYNQKISVQEYKFLPGIGKIATVNSATRILFSGVVNKQGEAIKTKDQVLFNKLKAGDPVMGQVVSVNTTPYEIGGRTVTKFTTFVFEGEDVTKIVNNLLRSKGAVMVDALGNLTAELPKNDFVAEMQP